MLALINNGFILLYILHIQLFLFNRQLCIQNYALRILHIINIKIIINIPTAVFIYPYSGFCIMVVTSKCKLSIKKGIY